MRAMALGRVAALVGGLGRVAALVGGVGRVAALVGGLLLATPQVGLACAGLIGSNGAVNLGRTTTLAAYHDGVEHYVTAFKFLGGGGQFGTLIPLPAVPTHVERGGAWTLQRLVRETQSLRAVPAASPAASAVEVVSQVRIDALDLTVLKGGGPAVADWAHAHGFSLSPDAPEVLDSYAQQSPVFLAAIFDGDAALQRGQNIGDATPVHLTLPVPHAWVPLRILGLGKQPTDQVDADVFLVTDNKPDLAPEPRNGFALAHSAPATSRLLDDLRADAGMSWVPHSGWLTELSVSSRVADLTYDLNVNCAAAPSSVMAIPHAPVGLPYALVLVVLIAPWVGLWWVVRRA